jgi:hypothetical protein
MQVKGNAGTRITQIEQINTDFFCFAENLDSITLGFFHAWAGRIEDN